jgi:hypothetical protein
MWSSRRLDNIIVKWCLGTLSMCHPSQHERIYLLKHAAATVAPITSGGVDKSEEGRFRMANYSSRILEWHFIPIGGLSRSSSTA